jgi:capsular exopolysaccharide synthesis family protein
MWQRHPKNTPLPDAAPAVGTGAPRGRPLRALLVTSPGPAEGKSISVVNLAAAFAETGMSVIIIDADFRRPTQYRYLDRPKSPNLGDVDITCEPEDLEAVLQDTEVPGVRLAASAPTRSDPGHAIAVAKSAVRAATQLADLVIVDSPPLLLANDAADLALGVDAAVLLARAGWTRRSGIVASADLMRRLEAPVIGIVIVGAEHGVRAGYYGYYGYYGYGYGYAHPGEVSIVKRLMPWRSRKAQVRPGVTVGGRGSGNGHVNGNGHGATNGHVNGNGKGHVPAPAETSRPVTPPASGPSDDPWV